MNKLERLKAKAKADSRRGTEKLQVRPLFMDMMDWQMGLRSGGKSELPEGAQDAFDRDLAIYEDDNYD